MVKFVGWGAGPDSSYATRTANLGTAQKTAERWNKFNTQMNLMRQLTSDVGNLIEAPGSERYAAKVAADKEARKANMETVDAYGGAFDRQEKVVTGLQTHIASLIENGETPSQDLYDKLAQAESLRDQYGANYKTALASIGILGGDTADEKRKKIASGDQADTSRENFWSKGTPLRYPAEGGVTEVPIGGYKEVVGTELLTAGNQEAVNQEAVNPNAEDVDSSFFADGAMNLRADVLAPAVDTAVQSVREAGPAVEEILKNPDLLKQWGTNLISGIFPSEGSRILQDAGYGFDVRPEFPIETRGGPTSPPARDTRRSALPPIGEVGQQALDLGSSIAEKVSGAWQDITATDTWKNILKEPANVGKGPGASEKAKEVSIQFMKDLPENMSDMGRNFLNRIDTFGDSILETDYGRANQEEAITLKEVAIANLVGALSAIPAGRALLTGSPKAFEQATRNPKVKQLLKDFLKKLKIKSDPRKKLETTQNLRRRDTDPKQSIDYGVFGRNLDDLIRKAQNF